MAGSIDQDEFICAICCDEYKDPVIIQCHHSFCRKCITEWINHNKSINGTYTCPTCKEINEMVPLKTSFVVEQMRAIVEKTKKVTSSYPQCDRHADEDLRFYCRDCETPVCRDCRIVKHHQGHEFDTIETVASEFKCKIIQNIHAANEDKFLLNDRRSEVDAIIFEAQQEKEIAVINCNKRRDELKADIERLTDNLVDKIKENVNNEVFKYTETRRALEDDVYKIESYIEQLTKFCDTNDDNKIVSDYKTILNKQKPEFDEQNMTRTLNTVNHENVFESGETHLTTLQGMIGKLSVDDPDHSSFGNNKSTTGHTQEIGQLTAPSNDSKPDLDLNFGSQSDLGTRCNSVKQSSRSCGPSLRTVKGTGRPFASVNRPGKVAARSKAPASRSVKLKERPEWQN